MFDKNTNSVSVRARKLVCAISLATIEVCVFCAVASVAALFYFWRDENEKIFIFGF